MGYTCEYCGTEFTLTWNLNKHKNTAKYCLEKQGRVIDSKEYHCDYCDRSFDRKDVLERHYKTCKKKHDMAIVNNTINQIQKDQFEAQNSQLLTLITQLQETILGMQGNGTSGTTINRNNVVMNNLLPLTDEDLQEHLEHLTLNFIQKGAKGYADFAGNYPFKGRLVCTDKSRKKLRYKDSDGEVVEDGGGVKLAQRFFQAIAPRNEEIINAEYKSLHEEVQQIAQEGSAHRTDLTGILTKATHLQELLIKSRAAARGEENELTREFVKHLTKML